MVDVTASVDPGNGGTNATALIGSKTKYFYEPSIRTPITGNTLGIGDSEMSFDYTDWNTFRYATGDDAIKANRRLLERHMGSNRYGDEFHQFLVANAVGKMGVKEGTVALTLFAPPGLFKEARVSIQERFLENNGKVEIKFKGDKKPRMWRYESVKVWPEGIGAAACFIIDDQGNYQPSDIFNGETIILDSGAHTLDAIKMFNGQFNPETLEHATWETGGLHIHVREPILRALKKSHDDFANLTVDDVDRVIRLGMVSGDFVITAGTAQANIKGLLDKHAERYAEWIANNILDGVFGGLRGIKTLIIVGGGAVLIFEYLLKWYGTKLLNPKQHPTTKKIHPVDFNSVGGLRLALMEQAKR